MFHMKVADFNEIYSSVRIVLGYRLHSQGSIPSRSKRFFSAPQHPDPLQGPPSLPSNGYQGLFSQGVKLTTYLNQVPRSQMVELYLHSPISLHGMVLN
jgi:hypothetical protein